MAVGVANLPISLCIRAADLLIAEQTQTCYNEGYDRACCRDVAEANRASFVATCLESGFGLANPALDFEGICPAQQFAEVGSYPHHEITITNLTNQPTYNPYIPPHGKRLLPGESYTMFGTFNSRYGRKSYNTKARRYIGLVNAIATNTVAYAAGHWPEFNTVPADGATDADVEAAQKISDDLGLDIDVVGGVSTVDPGGGSGTEQTD